jgi:hypothetical protein
MLTREGIIDQLVAMARNIEKGDGMLHLCSGVDLMAIRGAAEILQTRVKDYQAWAAEIGVHTCTNCKRAGERCPINNYYALPEDGYCHLWEGKNGTSHHTS